MIIVEGSRRAGINRMYIVASAAAIWSSADIAYIAIYRDMSKISRYSIAIYLSIFIEQLLINNHTIFMQVEAALLWWRHKNKHIKCYLAREGGKETLDQLVYIYRYT